MPKILTKIRKVYKSPIDEKFEVYMGYITVKSDRGKYLYSQSTGITRLTREDALNDAIRMKKDIIGE